MVLMVPWWLYNSSIHFISRFLCISTRRNFRVKKSMESCELRVATGQSKPNFMSLQHRKIPLLPDRPYICPIRGPILRSYPVGRQNFSRAYQGKTVVFTLSREDAFPDGIQARLGTALISNQTNEWTDIPFRCADERTLICEFTPVRPGLFSFRAEFSLDGGLIWLPDNVPDAWILVDPPQVDDVCLYTLIPNASGTIADWKSALKQIQEMGFNTVHLLPVTSLDTSLSPYAVSDLFDIDYSYLAGDSSRKSLSQLEDFIEEAKARNIRLCFDLVLNHVGLHSKMVQRAPDWIVPDQNQSDGFKRAGYWSHQGWQNWEDLVLINYEHPSEAIRSEIWEYMTAYALFWSHYANATGGFVRFDNLHSSDQDFIKHLTASMRTEYPTLGILAEYFTDDRTLLKNVPQWGLNLVLATPWTYKFVPELREYLTYIHGISEQVRYLMPITSHDSGAPAQEFGTIESTVPRYIAAALLGTGATGISQGVEWGVPEKINFIGRNLKKEYTGEPKFATFLNQVNAILAAHPVFRRGGNCRFVDNGHHAVIAAFRQDPESHSTGYLVICNFDTNNSQDFATDLTSLFGVNEPLSCRDLLSGEEQDRPHLRLEIRLLPCTARVLIFTAK